MSKKKTPQVSEQVPDPVPEPQPSPLDGVKMMDGTTSHESYMCFARRGDIGLGVKLLGTIDGARLGAENRTYLAIRIRSANIKTLFEHVDPPSQVVNLSEHKLSLDEAWPNVVFEKIDSERASTVAGQFVRVKLSLETLLDVANKLDDAAVYDKMAAFLVEKAGVEHLVCRSHVISSWLYGEMKPHIAAMRQQVAGVKVVDDTLNEHEGIVGFQQQQMKLIYEALHGKQEQPEPEIVAAPIIIAKGKGTDPDITGDDEPDDSDDGDI